MQNGNNGSKKPIAKRLLPRNPDNNGRITEYNEEIADRICYLVSISTLPLEKLCELNPDIPKKSAIYEWRIKHSSFADKYALAKIKQAILFAEEIIELADEVQYCDDGKGGKRIDPGFVAAQRLKVDTRKWVVCKMLPKLFGDRTTVAVTGEENHIKFIADLIGSKD